MLHARVLVVTACTHVRVVLHVTMLPMCYPCAAIHVERHGYTTVTMKLHVEVSRSVSLGVGNVPRTRGSCYCTFWASS